MTFKKVIRVLNALIGREKPDTFSSSWIFYHNQSAYQFIAKNIRTKLGDIDWDKVVSSLDKKFQKLLHPKRHNPKHRVINFYRNKKEVELALKIYQEKLYVFATALSLEDHFLRDTISIALVRIAQKGNKRAEEKLFFVLEPFLQLWFEKYPYLSRWRGHKEELHQKIRHCIYYYRFTGSFLGYLFQTLRYSARGLPRAYQYSLDAYIPGTELQLVDTLTRDPQTGRVAKAADIGFYYFH